MRTAEIVANLNFDDSEPRRLPLLDLFQKNSVPLRDDVNPDAHTIRVSFQVIPFARFENVACIDAWSKLDELFAPATQPSLIIDALWRFI